MFAAAAPLLLAMLAQSAAAVADTLLVVRKSADALDFFDPGSGLRLATVAVGFAPHEVSVSPDGRLAAVSNYGTRDEPGSTLSIVDLAEPRELRRIDLAPHTRPHGVAWFAPDRLAVTAEGSQHLLLVEPSTGRIVRSVPTGQDVSHMVAVDSGTQRAFVANIGSGSVTAVDLRDGPPPATRSVATGAGTEAIALHPDGRMLWLAARADGTLSRLDPSSLDRIGGAVRLPGVPIRIAFAPSGTTAYVTCAGSAEIVVFDAADGRELRRRRLDLPRADGAAKRPFAVIAADGSLPVGVAVARDGKSVFVAATMADRVVVLEAASLETLRLIEVDGEPDGLALTPVIPRATCHACGQEGA